MMPMQHQPSSFNESVSAEIRAEMARQSITQHDLASRLSWAQSQLSKRLRGVVPFSTHDIERLADALGIPPHQLTSSRAAAG
jgi:transcriptional regulator with XRE-family HTH domain